MILLRYETLKRTFGVGINNINKKNVLYTQVLVYTVYLDTAITRYLWYKRNFEGVIFEKIQKSVNNTTFLFCNFLIYIHIKTQKNSENQFIGLLNAYW